MESNIKKSIKMYKNRDYSTMASEAKDSVLDLFVHDDEKPNRTAKIQISTHLLLMGKAYEDKRLLRMAVEALMVDEKTSAIDILLRTSEILEEEKFR